MNSQQVFEVIEQIAATNSKLAKEALVAEHSGDETFVRVLKCAVDPTVTFGVDAIPTHAEVAEGQPFTLATWQVLDSLANRSLTGNQAQAVIVDELESLDPQSAELFKRILRKNLRAGISSGTVNKAVKGLIPEFPYQRCSLPADADLDAWPWEQGVISQLKADAMFANLDVEVTGRVAMRSRQGTEFPMGQLESLANEARHRLAPGFQYHGEVIVCRDDEELPRAESNGVMDRIVDGGAFEPNEFPIYVIWDKIPLVAIMPKGKHVIPYWARLDDLKEDLSQHAGAHLALIESRLVHSLAEARAHAAEVMKRGKEGTIVKHPSACWRDGTSKEQVKIKLEFEVDLAITGINLGKVGTKLEGRAATLSCQTSDGLLLVDVTIKNEAMRKLVEAFPDTWIGKVIAVVANDITEPGESNDKFSLYLPRMAEASYRSDKVEADSLGRVKAQKHAAIYGEELLVEAA